MPLPEWRTGYCRQSCRESLFPGGTDADRIGTGRRAHHPAYPETIQPLAARIDRLPSETKRLLQTAAIIGHDVPIALLQTVDCPELL